MKETIFLLGAGASVDAGMPTVTELTKKLRASLPNVRDVNGNPRPEFAQVFDYLVAQDLSVANNYERFFEWIKLLLEVGREPFRKAVEMKMPKSLLEAMFHLPFVIGEEVTRLLDSYRVEPNYLAKIRNFIPNEGRLEVFSLPWAMVPEVPLLVKDAKRQCDRWRDTTKSLRHEWIKEFYRLRGDFAHGRLKTKQPAVWNPLEHIVLATIVFPLLVRCLLKKKTKYEVGDTEQARIDAFENLADEQFLSRPTDQKNSMDSVWSRRVKEARSILQRRNIEKNLKAKGLWEEKPGN